MAPVGIRSLSSVLPPPRAQGRTTVAQKLLPSGCRGRSLVQKACTSTFTKGAVPRPCRGLMESLRPTPTAPNLGPARAVHGGFVPRSTRPDLLRVRVGIDRSSRSTPSSISSSNNRRAVGIAFDGLRVALQQGVDRRNHPGQPGVKMSETLLVDSTHPRRPPPRQPRRSPQRGEDDVRRTLTAAYSVTPTRTRAPVPAGSPTRARRYFRSSDSPARPCSPPPRAISPRSALGERTDSRGSGCKDSTTTRSSVRLAPARRWSARDLRDQPATERPPPPARCRRR